MMEEFTTWWMMLVSDGDQRQEPFNPSPPPETFDEMVVGLQKGEKVSDHKRI